MDFVVDDQVQSVRIINYQIIFWLFMVGSFFGFVLEGLWCIVKTGYWENHAAVVWGPFCIIYGIGAVAAFLLSQLLLNKHLVAQFGAFFFSGSLVEYFASLFQEICFGSVSWDYSAQFMNIGGRVSLKMALIWGILGMLFMRFLFPLLKVAFEKCNKKSCALIYGILTVFMVANLAVTSVVVTRWQARLSGASANSRIEQSIDYLYGDTKMEQLFPNMQFKKTI